MTKRFKRLVASILLYTLVLPIFQPPALALFGFFNDEANTPQVVHRKLVSVLVEESLMEESELSQKIERYATDVQKKLEAKVVLVPIPRDASPRDIYEGNAHLYFSGVDSDGKSQLIGTVLIGHVPLPVVEKQGNLWPTIYPYTDFEDTVYTWNPEKERFVFRGGDHESEIWHGVIRSNAGEGVFIDPEDKKQAQIDELKDYFNQNNLVHEGTTTFGKKVLYVDLDLQKEGLDSALKTQYDQWLARIEEVAYLRFTKHLAKEILSETDVSGELPLKLVDSAQRPTSFPDNANDALKMPDVPSAKFLIENSMKRYFEAWANALTQINERVGVAQRWGETDIDTTISLVSQKDELSVVRLKALNDKLETALQNILTNRNVATNISVPKVTDDIFTETSGQPEGNTLYWNGVDRSTLTAENCSLLRGSPRSTETPFAQMVEANHTFHLNTNDDCPRLTDESITSTAQAHADAYEGCCASNLKMDTTSLTYSFQTVDTDIINYPNPPYSDQLACKTHSYWTGGGNHIGATTPIFDLQGTREVTTGNQGASGCSSIVDATEEDQTLAHRFDSLMIHNEPQAATLTAQLQDMSANALPVDDPRGFSFYDHGKTFRRLDFFNVFDMRKFPVGGTDAVRQALFEAEIKNRLKTKIQEINTIITNGNTTSNARLAVDRLIEWPGTYDSTPGYICTYGLSETNPDTFTTLLVWTEACTQIGFPDIINTLTRYYETGVVIDESYLEQQLSSSDLANAADALVWIDKTLQQKNKLVFETALGEVAPAQTFFGDTSFNGYEFVEIIGESAESGRSDSEGIKMTFEEGDEPNSQEYKKAQAEASLFGFDDAENPLDFLGEDFEENILQRTAIEEQCELEDFEEKLRCYERENANQEETYVTFSPDGEPQVFSPGREETVLDQVSSIDISPAGIHVSSRNTEPIRVEVRLRNAAGQTVDSDFESEVTLKFSSSDAARFFTITPSQTRTVTSGEAVFYLVPKGSHVGGTFLMWARDQDGLKSPLRDVLIQRYSPSVSLSKTALPVRDLDGTQISLRIQDSEGNLSRDLDGERVRLTSSWGNFGERSVLTISEGIAEGVFSPGHRSGEGEITVTSVSGSFAPESVSVDILPGPPAKLAFVSEDSFLVEGEDWREIEVVLQDAHGNNIENTSHDLTWAFEGIALRGGPSGQLTQMDVRGEGSVWIRPKKGVGRANLTVSSSEIPARADEVTSIRKNFIVVRDAVLTVDVGRETLPVGSEDLVSVTVRAETPDGQVIPARFEVQIVPDIPGVGVFPSSVVLEDGLGNFTIQAGERSGVLSLTLSSPGFTDGLTSLDIRPDEAVKILLSSDKNSLEIGSDEELYLDIKIVDRFGNVVPETGRKISILSNEPEVLTTEDSEELEDLEIIDEVSDAKFYLDQQAANARESGFSPDESLLTFEDGSTVTLTRGTARVKVTPTTNTQTTTGKIFLTARGEGLTSAGLIFDVIDYLSASEVSDLKPHTMFTLMLGFAGGDLIPRKTFANQYLFSGESQAVGTLITDPNPYFNFGYVGGDGSISPKLQAHFIPGDAAEFELLSDGRSLGRAQILFPSPELFLSVSGEMEEEGVHFVPEVEMMSDIRIEYGTLIYQNKSIFALGRKGGLVPVRGSGVRFDVEREGSLLKWNVFVGGERIGGLHFVFTPKNPVEVSEFADRLDAGIFVRKDAADTVLREIFTGKSTNDVRGMAFFSSSEKQGASGSLGSPKNSIEDIRKDKDIVWEGDWKPGTFFAGQNSIGMSSLWGASDAFVLFGDPTLSVSTANTASPLRIVPDIGKQIWKADGDIDQIEIGDINGDNFNDIFVRVGQELFVLYQNNMLEDNFREVGPVLRFGDGVETFTLFDNDQDNFSDLLHVTDDREVILHKNTNGTYVRGSIDLGLDHKIFSLQSARLNGDDFDDLVVLDETNCLYKILGQENGFTTPEKVYCFHPDFEQITEDFTIAGYQDELDRYLDPDRFPYLDEFYITYRGIDTDITAETDRSFVKNLEILGEGTTRLIAIPENKQINAKLDMFQRNIEGIQQGDRIQVEMTISASNDVSELEILAPRLKGLRMVPESLICEECEVAPTLKEGPEGGFWLEGLALEKDQDVLLQWELEVAEQLPVRYFVDDYYGGDSIDDTVIPWETSNGRQVAKIASNVAGGGVDFSDVTSYIEPTRENLYAGKTDAEIAQTLLTQLSADSDNDSIPDMYETLGNLNLGSLRCSGTCGPAGISIALFAPGPTTIYLAPIAIPGPPSPGLPALAFPTTLPTPFGPIPFLWPPSPIGMQTPAPFISQFRMYVMPTTTGKVGMAICTGPYSLGMTMPPPVGNCFTFVPPITAPLGACPTNVGGTLSDLNNSFFAEDGTDWNTGRKKPVLDLKIVNKKIASADIISTWIGRQYEEFANISFPKMSVILPNIPDLGSLSDDVGVFQRLSEMPFTNLKKTKVSISYPNVNAESFARMKEEFWSWGAHFTSWHTDAWEEIKNFEAKLVLKRSVDFDANFDFDGATRTLENAKAYVRSAADIFSHLKNNIQAIESYVDGAKDLEQIPREIEEVLGSVMRNAEIMEEHFRTWLVSLQRSVKRWSEFRTVFAETLEGWARIAELFQDFTASCPTCSVDRGTMQEWLLRILLGSIKLPVIDAPRLPDVKFDFSGITGGFDIVVPDIDTKPVDIAFYAIPPKLPTFTLPDVNESFGKNVSGGVDVSNPEAQFGTLPRVARLPKLQKVTFDATPPSLVLPSLPTFPTPPKLPNLLKPVESIVRIPRAFFRIMCLLVLGVVPVPEHYLAAQISQLTNRERNTFSFDFRGNAFSPVTPTKEDPEQIEFSMGTDFSKEFLFLEKQAKGLEELFSCMTKNASAASKGAEVEAECALGKGEEIAQEISPPETKTVVIDLEEEFSSEKVNLSEESKALLAGIDQQIAVMERYALESDELPADEEKEKGMFDSVMAFLEHRGFAAVPNSLLPAKYRRWLASTVDTDLYPTSLPTDFDLTTFQANQRRVEQEPAIYYMDSTPSMNEAEKVTLFPMQFPMTSDFDDLVGEDDKEEILYSLNNELFLKYRDIPDRDTDDLRDRYIEKFQEDYDDRHSSYISKTYEWFKELFVPTQNLSSRTEITGSQLQFERLFDEVSYFEWVLSDRPDSIFERAEEPSDRKSLLWDRNAFLLRGKPTRYEIRPMSTKVTNIKGSPVLYGAPLEKIEKLSQEDCSDEDTPKPFFASESILVGVAGESRMEIRVPPRENQDEELREIVIREGEETLVEYAEVCLTRGEVERISTQDAVRIESRENLYLPPGARFELGEGDEVEIEIFDGTKIVIKEKEKYSVHYFENADEIVDLFKHLPKGNHYGYLQGFRSDGSSLLLPTFLHDPQLADDVTPPRVQVKGGTDISVQFNQGPQVDATRSYDDHSIAKVWWDLDGEVDRDEDGDSTNDWDFPNQEIAWRYETRDLLKATLPAYRKPGKYNAVLNVEDASGNLTQKILDIHVEVPEIELLEASLESRSLTGVVLDNSEGVPIHFMRKRDGNMELVREEAVLSDVSGNFQVRGLSTSGGFGVYDEEGNEVVEILPNGRPVILSDRFVLSVESATDRLPFRVVVRESRGGEVLWISFEGGGDEVSIQDADESDQYIFRTFPRGILPHKGTALIDQSQNKTLGMFDSRGDFYLTPGSGVSFGLKRAVDGMDPVVFQVFSSAGDVVGEFEAMGGAMVIEKR